MSFFVATEGLGFAAEFDADAVMDAVAVFAAADVLAATALHNPGHCIISGSKRQTYSLKFFTSSPSLSLRSRSSSCCRSLMESRNIISSSSSARNWLADTDI